MEVKSLTLRQARLLPSVQYGNVTIEATITVGYNDGDESEKVHQFATNELQNALDTQKNEIDKMARGAFSVPV